jgi:hypothetical protein
MRPGDWSALGLATDPTPGDPVLVLAGGQDYLEVAEAIQRAATNAQRLEVSGSTISEAVDALMEAKDETIGEIQRAHDRYRTAGAALVEYAGVLERVQGETAAALTSAQQAQADAESASSSRSYYLDLVHDVPDEQKPEYQRLADRYADQADAAAGAVASARSTVETAVADRDRAAERAISRIQDIVSDDGLNDGWWEDWGSDLVAAITDVAGWVSTITGVLALAVCWIPVVGQALAGVLLAVSAVSAAVNAIGNVVLASTGDRSWTEAVVSIAGAALACVGLGGVARVAGRVITRRVLLREASTGLTAAGRAAGSGTYMLGDASNAVDAFRGQDAWRLLRNDPRALLESARSWTTAVRPPRTGDEVYRVFGDDAAREGQSWSTVAPYQLHNPRSTLGLPTTGGASGYNNSMEGLVVGTVEDVGQMQGYRHALPLDGNPGGAPELLFRGWSENGAIAVRPDASFRVR